MPFVVRYLDKVPENKSHNVVSRVRYPEHEVTNVVVSSLELWEVDANVVPSLSMSDFLSHVRHDSSYNILLIQKDLDSEGKAKSLAVFVLHEQTGNIQKAHDAFKAIRSIVEPLVDDCNVMLTADLLKELILPEPKDPTQLVSHLVEVMHSKPKAHPRWNKVLQAVVDPALRADNEDHLQLLLNEGMKPGATNRKGETPLHRAASLGSAKFVKKLIEATKSDDEKRQLLEQLNKEGKTSLLLAFEQDNPDAACELLEAGATLSTPVSDDSTHFDFTNAFNTHDKKGFTPLMLAIRKKYLKSSVSLLVAGADPNVKHLETGDTALHYASEVGKLVLVRLLIVFFADLKVTNNAGKTPLDIAQASKGKEAAKCVSILKNTLKMMDKAAATDVSDTFEPIPIPDSDDSTFLLAFDGGGMKCLASLQIIFFLYKRMKQLKPNCGPLKSYFDYMTGTSAGSYLALGFGYRSASPETIRAGVFQICDEVITGPIPFSAEKMKRCLKELLGDGVKMDSITKPRIAIATVLGHKDPPELHLICNYGESRDGLPGPSTREVWEAARASLSAPVVFEPFEGKLIDGGVVANNPTLAALTDIIEQGKKEQNDVKIGLVLSIGTGIVPTTDFEKVGVVPYLGEAGFSRFMSMINIRDAVSGIIRVMNQFVSQATSSDGLAINIADAWCTSIGTKYHRFSPKLSRIYGLIEVDKPTLTEIMYDGHVFALQHTKEIDEVARILLTRGPVN